MRGLFTVLGLITSILAVVLSITPLSKIAYIPAVVALIFGLIAFYISRQQQYPKKSIQLIFLLTIISLSITTYKTIFNVAKVGNVKGLELKEKESEAKAIEELEDLELEGMDLEIDDPIELIESDSIKQ